MEDKSLAIRNHILQRLEQGLIQGGDKLPGTRDLAQEVGVSLVTVQGAIEVLSGEGVLETLPRRGVFVHPQWNRRVLQRNIALFRTDLDWLGDLREVLARELPELWATQCFRNGVFEIRTTHWVQSRHNEYLDLSGLFADAFPDTGDFFMEPFDAFRFGSKLAGVPIIYSPRVVFYNPELFARAGCPKPRPDWTIDEFRECLRKLGRILPPEDVLCWHPQPFYWINFVARAGGSLIDPEAADPVRIDSDATRRGLRLFRDLRHDMGLPEYAGYPDRFARNFFAGRAAMTVEPREFRSRIRTAGFERWDTAPLPRIEGGREVSVQATDVFCVRRECVNTGLARRLMVLLLSPEFQDRLGAWKYGLPIRKSAAGRSIDYHDPRDMLFLTETPKMHSHYNLDSAELYALVCDGIANLLAGNDDIDAGTAELADMARTYLKISRQKKLRTGMAKEKTVSTRRAGKVALAAVDA